MVRFRVEFMCFFVWFSMGISFAEHPEQLVLATVTGSLNAPLAQLVEQLTLNQWVPGSKP